MADETVSVEIPVEAARGAKTLGDLKKQVEGLRQEIEGEPIGSKRFDELAGAIQKAESRTKTLEKTFEGLEPQQVAESFVKVGEAIAGGFAAAQGAAILFGEENEEIQEAVAKSQAAISLAIGVKDGRD